MKAPKYQRAEMLQAVVSRAVMATNAPIDHIEVVDGAYLVSAGKKRLVLHCVWVNGVSGDGIPLLGDGAWVARTEDDADEAERSADFPETSLPQNRRFSTWRIVGKWFQRWR